MFRVHQVTTHTQAIINIEISINQTVSGMPQSWEGAIDWHILMPSLSLLCLTHICISISHSLDRILWRFCILQPGPFRNMSNKLFVRIREDPPTPTYLYVTVNYNELEKLVKFRRILWLTGSQEPHFWVHFACKTLYTRDWKKWNVFRTACQNVQAEV